MGAIPFEHMVDGYDAKEAFQALVNDAVATYGNDCYNGTISTCSLGSIEKIADVYSEDAKLKAERFIEDHDGGEKWEATCLDLGVIAYDVAEVKKEVVKSSVLPIWKQRYVVFYDTSHGEVSSGVFEKKTDADKCAVKCALKDPDHKYYVSKRPTIINVGSDVVTKVTVKTTMGKAMQPCPRVKQSANRVIKERHRYIFFGYAAE